MDYNLWSVDDIICDMNKRKFMSKDEKMSIQHYLGLYENNKIYLRSVRNNMKKELVKSENEKKELLFNYNRLNEMYERSQDYIDDLLENEKKILNERNELFDKKQKMTDEMNELYEERENLIMEKNELAYKNCLLNKKNDIVRLQNVKLTNAYNDIIFQYNELKEKHYDLVKICKQIKEYTEEYEEYEEDEKDEKDEKGIEEDKEENDTRKRKINVNSIEPEQSVSKKINIDLEKK